jgi:hypothetical protein
MKTELTQDDLNRLDAARGLTLELNGPGVVRPYNNGTGRKPSVLIYNTAVKKGILLGAPIMPVDEVWYRK